MSDTGHTELLPCPFCGGEPKSICGAPGSCFIECRSCGAQSDDGGLERVTAAWNRRASPSLPILVEALEPFAEASDKYHPHIDSETPLNPAPFPGGPDSVNLVVGHLRRARAALASIKGGG